jgi:DNA-directed RNA polymerase subunit RPC12/RpoP
MQMLHPHCGSIQQYMEDIDDPDRGRPSRCPQCRAKEPLTSHGFYSRTIVDEAFDGLIRIRRYLCQRCSRTVSVLPEWALPFMRFSIAVIARTVKARLMENRAWKLAAPEAAYQRAQHWVRRFSKQAEPLSSALAALTAVIAAPSFVSKALGMLEKIGWMAAHRFLFSDLRMHLLGWGQSLAPHGLRITINAVSSTPGALPQTTCIDSENPSD